MFSSIVSFNVWGCITDGFWLLSRSKPFLLYAILSISHPLLARFWDSIYISLCFTSLQAICGYLALFSLDAGKFRVTTFIYTAAKILFSQLNVLILFGVACLGLRYLSEGLKASYCANPIDVSTTCVLIPFLTVAPWTLLAFDALLIALVFGIAKNCVTTMGFFIIIGKKCWLPLSFYAVFPILFYVLSLFAEWSKKSAQFSMPLETHVEAIISVLIPIWMILGPIICAGIISKLNTLTDERLEIS